LAAAIVLGVLLVGVCAAATVVDLRERRIPNALTGPAALAALALGLALDPGGEVERVAAALLGGGVLLVLALVQPAGMGMGDVKLTGVIGLCVGQWVLLALIVGSLGGVLLGAGLAVRRGVRAAGRTQIAFGPFLALGGLVAAVAQVAAAA
jgi:leader peptidase (prepilin peptidase)/N-methyltransferase